MTPEMADRLRVVDILALDGTQPVGASLVGSASCRLNVGCKTGYRGEGFLGPDPTDDRVEAALVTFAHGLSSPPIALFKSFRKTWLMPPCIGPPSPGRWCCKTFQNASRLAVRTRS